MKAGSHHPDWFAGAHVIVVCVPALELGVLSALEDVLLALEVRMIEADPGGALHTDRVDPVHEAAVLEVITVSIDLQSPAGEAAALVKHDLRSSVKHHQSHSYVLRPKSSLRIHRLLVFSLFIIYILYTSQG